MKRLPRLSCLFLLLLFTISCNRIFSQSALPDSWPDNMELKISYGGGMRYYSTELVIRLEAAYSLINEEGRELRKELKFTRQELDQLLQVFRAQALDQIHSEPRKGIIYDMGTTSTLLSWNNRVAGVSIGASTYLPDRYLEQYHAIRAGIDRLLAGKGLK